MTKHALRVVLAVVVGAAALAALFALLLSRACGSGVPSLHERVTPKRIDKPATHWLDEGFVEMVPPVRLPTDKDAKDRIRVWLKVGDGKIGVKHLADGTPLLTYPPNTIADRVESVGDAVVDVRGTTLVEDGELFHVYVPEGTAPSPLTGWEWRRGDLDAQASATVHLLAQLERTRRRIRGMPPATEQQHQGSLRAYERNNACAGCHVHEKPLVLEGNGIHRPTDAVGFFVPQSVLADSVPLERHRPWDLNADDPFLTITCPSGGATRVVERPAARHVACPGFDIPVGRLDVQKGLEAGDERTKAMCASRRALYERMDDEARAAFAPAFSACGIE